MSLFNLVALLEEDLQQVKAYFNNWLGSNKTWVSNSTGRPIWVCVSRDGIRLDIQSLKISKDGVDIGCLLRSESSESWVRIPSGGSHEFMRRNAYDRLTVVLCRSSEGETVRSSADVGCIVSNDEIPANMSYIVTASEEIRRHKYGEPNFKFF